MIINGPQTSSLIETNKLV